MQTFINLPTEINEAIADILSQPDNIGWLSRAEALHERYRSGKKHPQESYIRDTVDVAAYLGLRIPATYAQIYSALLQLQEVIPEWKPKSVLDLGSGPGTGVWATKNVWPGIEKANCIDNEGYFLTIGRELFAKTKLSVDIAWDADSLRSDFGSKNNKYDLVILANVLNELESEEQQKTVARAFTQCSGVMIIIEPGTPHGTKVVESAYQNFDNKCFILAPYMENTFIPGKDHWIHFPQRFIRPEFQRRIRQHMRTSNLMASDWEETKYSYIALSKIAPKTQAWGRVISPVKKQKAWFDLTVLTKKGIEKLQVLKRHKEHYNLAKNLKWGDITEKNPGASIKKIGKTHSLQFG
jgi:ribosomal protein RSM22 (predicted rRNA methylase)